MQALLLSQYRKLELVSMEKPPIGPTDVLVRVAACGICGSDVHGYDGSSGRRVPPIVMGHEAAGTVVQTGTEVNRASVGDRVTFDSTVYCGECDACRSGQVNLCPHRRVLGVSCDEYRQHGAFAEFVAVPQHILHALPPELPFEHAALIEPVSVALHAVDLLKVQPRERAVVVGSGMIGLLVIQALRISGCGEVIAIDIDEGRLQLAAEVGATAAINSTTGAWKTAAGGWGRAISEPPAGHDSARHDSGGSAEHRPQAPNESPAVKAVMELTGGRGADVAAEVVGNARAISTAIRSVARGGRVVLVGNISPEVPLPLQIVVSRELTLLGSCASAGEYPRGIDLVASGQIRVDPLISAMAPLADGPLWFDRLYAREPGLMKVVLQPGGK
jgi:L-iditol 2-dehydrogenase